MLARLGNAEPRPRGGREILRGGPPRSLPADTAIPKETARPQYGTHPGPSGHDLQKSISKSVSLGSSATDRAFELVNGSGAAIMILGGAGTGKTTFLYALQKDRHKKQVFLAPTGVAALHLGGQTVHSFFGIPPRIINH